LVSLGVYFLFCFESELDGLDFLADIATAYKVTAATAVSTKKWSELLNSGTVELGTGGI